MITSNIFLVCQAELYLANRTETLCSNQAVFICANNDGPSIQWRITSVGGTKTLGFSLLFNTERVMSSIIESTPVRAEIIFGNSSYYYVTSLTIVATLSATIECNFDNIYYQTENGKQCKIH